MPALLHHNANAAPGRARSRRDWFAGTLIDLDPAGPTITVRLDSAGRPWPPPGSEVTVDVLGARVHATDTEGDGGLTDLFPGDRVHVTLRRQGGRLPIALRVRRSA